MISALTLALATQIAAIPPALPEDPGPERRAAAAALFPREPYVSEYNFGISIAAAKLSGETLAARDLNAHDRDFRLSDRLNARAKAAADSLIDEAIKCVAEPIAQRLYVPDLVALKAFAASPEGRNFWSYYMGELPWQACFNRPVRAYLASYLEEDLAAVIAETPSGSIASSGGPIPYASEPPAEETLFAQLAGSSWAEAISRHDGGPVARNGVRRVSCIGLETTYMLCAWEQRIGSRWLKRSQYADISLTHGPIRLIGDRMADPD